MADHPMRDERAERAILSHAEAYRLVEEVRQMREERDAARAEVVSLTSERDRLLGFKVGALEQAARNRREVEALTRERDALREAARVPVDSGGSVRRLPHAFGRPGPSDKR